MELYTRKKNPANSENDFAGTNVFQKDVKAEKNIGSARKSQFYLNEKNQVQNINDSKRILISAADKPEPKTPKLAKLQDLVGIVHTDSFSTTAFKTPEAALDAILNSAKIVPQKPKSTSAHDQSHSSTTDKPSTDIGFSPYYTPDEFESLKKIINDHESLIENLKLKLDLALSEKLLFESRASVLESENLSLNSKLVAISEKLSSVYSEYVPNSDFQEICFENKKLKDDLAEKDALLKECESLLADLVE
ncbi:hypothetical protein AYI68_g7803 [Smittium mucronatum]|uniref:Uncharacterized protein n=1 Tax=Smittium mucronatum TaxID=133383 RepID=A0A1R0GMM7_9FUNG|nr:hypothetical protein AYI68_g7803 [Smittium mucronatum]